MKMKHSAVAGMAAIFLLGSVSAQARFLQTDPVGSKDDLDLYAYTANDPLNKTDPTGNGAIIDYVGPNTINIVVPMIFNGPAATQQNIQNVQQDTASHFNGSYSVNGQQTNVTVMVVPATVSNLPSQLNNQMTLTNGPTSLKDSSNPARDGISNVKTNGDGSTKGEINTQDKSAVSSGMEAHEMGHVMNEGDHYSEGHDAQGNRTTQPDPGYSGNLMGQLPGKVDDKNINTIVNSPNNISCGRRADGC